jgi:AcrR family transcriptional regulator
LAPRSIKLNDEMKSKTKTLLLDSALNLFARRGYHTTSISDIAKAAGVSKGLMYHYYKGKEDLLESIVNGLITGNEVYLDLLKKEGDPYEILLDLVNIMDHALRTQSDLIKLYHSLLSQPGILELFYGHTERLYLQSIDLVTKLMEKAGCAEPRADAELFLALIKGLQIHYMTLGDCVQIKAPVVNLLNKIKLMNQHNRPA